MDTSLGRYQLRRLEHSVGDKFVALNPRVYVIGNSEHEDLAGTRLTGGFCEALRDALRAADDPALWRFER